MNTKIFVGMCFMLGSIGTWNAWTLHQVTERLDQLEAREIEQSQASTSSIKEKNSAYSSQKRPVRRASKEITEFQKPKTTANRTQPETQKEPENSIDLSNPDVREAIAKIAQDNAQKKEEQRRKSKMEAYKTSIQHELEKFSMEKGYDAEITQKVQGILDESTSEWTAIRQQVREGEISWLDARTEFKAIGEETQSKATEFISEEDYKELRSRLWGQWD